MARINNGKKRPRIGIKKVYNPVEVKEILQEEVIEPVECVPEVEETPVEVAAPEEVAPVEEPTPEVVEERVEEPIEEPVAEETVEEVAEEVAPVEEVIEEPAPEEEIPETVEEAVEEVEEIDEVPLEMSEDEMQTALEEEGSLDGTPEEVEELAAEEEIPETVEETSVEEVVAEEVAPVEEPTPEVVEERVEEPIEEPVAEETVEEVAPAEEVIEEPAPEVAPVEEIPETVEEVSPAVEEVAASEAAVESEDEEEEEEKVEEKPKKDEFKLTPPANLDDILANICAKRARKLIYKPNEVIFSHTTTVLGTDKANDEKIKVKNILDAEIKQGVKLGYLDKFDGLKMSELKEEYENDIVYEYADQEFKRTGILLDGDKVKVYVYDWDMKACHHVGYIDDESAALVKPYIIDREKYSFDVNGIIVGGKFKKVIKDEATGKITVEKGNDGNLGLEIDINIINRKD